MKLKFTNVLLAAAIAFGAAVGFSSCKDTQDDMFMGVESEYAALKKKVDELQARLDAIKIPEIKDWALKSELTAAVEDLQGQIDDINDVLDTLDETYVDWETYNTKMQEIDEAIKKLDERVTDLEKEVKDIKQYLENIDKRISSIQLQGAKNPAFEMVNTPLNVKSLALFNYYGKVTDMKNNQGVSGEIWGGEKEGALGTLYFSANPIDLDLTDGYELALVTSAGDEAPVTLAEVAASEELLLMGGSRADTPLWEVAVTAEDGEALAIDFSAAKDKVLDIVKALRNKNIGSIGLLPEALKAAFVNNESMPAYALKITWEEVDTVTGETIQRAAISDFGIMVNTFEPLSFNTLAGEHGPELPMLPELDALKDKFNVNVDELAGKINIDFGNATLEIDIDGVTLKSEDGSVEISAESLEDLVAAIQEGAAGMTAQMAADVNAQIQDVVDTLKTKASNAIDKFSGIYDLLTKVYNKIADAIYTPNLVLQPVAFIGTEDGELHRMSEYAGLPTVVENGAFQIFATSWTGEFIAPAYLKKVTVNDAEVEGEDGIYDVTLADGLNTIVYTAVDFHGFEVAKTYYVQK